MQDLALFRARFILFARKLQDIRKKILHVQDLAQLARILHVLARRFYLGFFGVLQSVKSNLWTSTYITCNHKHKTTNKIYN